MPRPLAILLLLLLLFTASGAHCFPWRRPAALEPEPTPFAGQPVTLASIIEVVNRNTAAVRTLRATAANIAVAGYPTLTADITLERPKRFRLVGRTGITGNELDLGSNDEFFWMWVRRNSTPQVLYGRHDRYATSAARQQFAVNPEWLIQALGLVQLDPLGQHEGPVPAAAGEVQIRTFEQTAAGGTIRVLVLNERTGWITQQHLYTQQGELLATALCSQHLYKPEYGVSLPRRMEVRLPRMQLAFVIHIHDFAVNDLPPGDGSQWAMPRYDNHQYFDITDPGLQFNQQLSGPAPNAPGQTGAPALQPVAPAQPHYQNYAPAAPGNYAPPPPLVPVGPSGPQYPPSQAHLAPVYAPMREASRPTARGLGTGGTAWR